MYTRRHGDVWIECCPLPFAVKLSERVHANVQAWVWVLMLAGVVFSRYGPGLLPASYLMDVERAVS